MNDYTPQHSTERAAEMIGWNGPSLTAAAIRCGLTPAHVDPTRYRWSDRNLMAVRALLDTDLIGVNAKTRGRRREREAMNRRRSRIWAAVHDDRFGPGVVAVVPWGDDDVLYLHADEVRLAVTYAVGPASVLTYDTLRAATAHESSLC